MRIFTLLFVLLVLVCASLSVFSSYSALEAAFSTQSKASPLIAAMVGGVIFLAMCSCNLAIFFIAKRKGTLFWPNQNLLFPTFALLVVAAISTSTSFAFFYSISLRDKIANKRVSEATQIFRSNVNKAQSVLSKVNKNAKLRYDLDQLFQGLINEVRNPPKGFGQDAKKFIIDIDSKLKKIGGPGVERIQIPPRNASETLNEEALRQIKAAIDSQFKLLVAKDPITDALSKIAKVKENMQKSLIEVDVNHKLHFDKLVVIMLKLQESNAELGRTLRFGLDQSGVSSSNAILPKISTEALQLGTFDQVYESVFVRRDDPPIAIVSIIVALVLDFMPFIIANAVVAVIYSQRDRKQKNNANKNARRVKGKSHVPVGGSIVSKKKQGFKRVS